jgi:nucleoside-diphosphate-sugar epimerase
MEKSKGKVFVSGAHGFLAWHLINQLLENGYQVKGLTRRSGKIEIDYTESLEIVLGNMNDTEQMRQCTSDCDFMVHCAATTDMSLLNINDYYSPNVASTLSLLQAAVSNKIKKFIYIGTANSFASGTSSRLGNELSSIQSPFHKSGYALSKTKAMHLVLSYADQIHVNVLAPSFMLGAKANKNGSGQIINRALGKKLIFHPPGGKNFVHVKDVAKGDRKSTRLNSSH